MGDFRNQSVTINTNRTNIVRNMCRCTVCNSIIESKARHDFVQCTCGRIFTDGGQDYIRRGFVDVTDIEDLTEFAFPKPLTTE